MICLDHFPAGGRVEIGVVPVQGGYRLRFWQVENGEASVLADSTELFDSFQQCRAASVRAFEDMFADIVEVSFRGIGTSICRRRDSFISDAA